MGNQPPPPGHDQPAKAERQTCEPTLVQVQSQFPDWEMRPGINGLYYAHYPATGTQVCGEDLLDLRDQIKAANSRRACTPPGATAPIYQPGQM